MKKSTLASLLFAALAAAACQAVSVEEEPSYKEEEPQRISIPYSVNAAAGETRVAYGENGFSIKEGDKILVTGKTRTDIEGYLALTDPSSFTFSGNLTYLSNQDAPDASTELVATLVHAGNDNVSSYANAVIGFTGDVPMQEAAENYTLFQAEYLFGDESALALEQKASFLEMTVTVSFEGAVGFNAGLVPAGQTARIGIDDNGTSFEGTTTLSEATGSAVVAKCLAVVPAGKPLNSFHISVIDREVEFGAIGERTLEANKKYTVSRSISFQPQLGDPYWSDGTYGRFSHTDASIVGLVVYVNDGSDLGNAITESGFGGGHALVMALRNANTTATVGEKWATSSEQHVESLVKSPSQVLNPALVSGFSNTSVEYTDNNANAARLAKYYPASVSGTNTGWFLPSIGQWLSSICSYCEVNPESEWFDGNNKAYKLSTDWKPLIMVKKNDSANESFEKNVLVGQLNDRMQLFQDNYPATVIDKFSTQYIINNKNEVELSDNYWTSSEYSATDAIRMNLGSVKYFAGRGGYYSGIKMKNEGKGNNYAYNKAFIMRVRPFLAF